MKIRRSLLKDQVQVASYSGEGAYGPVYVAAVRVWCNVDATRRLVRDANGDEAVSEATLQLHPQTRTVPDDPAAQAGVVDPLAVFTPESQVTLPDGRTTKVMTAKADTMRGRPGLVEVTCA